MADFFRKEREEVFASRFSIGPDGVSWTVKPGGLIFQAKNLAERSFNVMVGGKPNNVKCKLVLGERALDLTYQDGAKLSTIKLNEAALADVVAAIEAKKAETVVMAAVKFLFQQHAKASQSSFLISGCVENNFLNGAAYEGRKLHLELTRRTPVKNPFASGVEKEYFLVGAVTSAECSKVHYLGTARENNVDELVSLIPRMVA